MISDTKYGEDLNFLIAEFMNLVDACRRKNVQFEASDGCDLEGYRGTINWYLGLLGHDKEKIECYWSGEDQLTSS